jgi:hypothetical protein
MKNWFKKNKGVEKGGNKVLSMDELAARKKAKEAKAAAAKATKEAAAKKAQELRDKKHKTPQEEKKAARADKNSTGRIIRDIISGKFLTDDGVVTHIPYLLFLCGLFLANIALGYKFENIETQKMRAKRDLEEVSAEYKTLISDLEARLQQSRVESATKSMGLQQPMSPPTLLKSSENE